MNGSMKPWSESGRIGLKLEPELGPEWTRTNQKHLGGHYVHPKANSRTFQPIPAKMEWNIQLWSPEGERELHWIFQKFSIWTRGPTILSKILTNLSSNPSVMYLILVELEVTSSNLIEYPTFWPNSTSHSSATRFATVTAATRRGWVIPITLPSREKPPLNKNCGNSAWIIAEVSETQTVLVHIYGTQTYLAHLKIE